MKAHAVSGKDLAKRLGVRESFVSQARKGKRPISPKSIPRWVQSLRLTESEAEEFTIEALLFHSPPQLREYVMRLRENQRRR
jgi:transcriptional regulator with XRE-family HTH domain